MSLILTADFHNTAVRHQTVPMKPTYEYLWTSLQKNYNTFSFRQTLDEFSEIQKLSRDVSNFPPVSKIFSFLFAQECKKAKSQKLAEILKSIESAAQEVLLSYFPSILPFLSGWPGYELWSKEAGGAEDHQPKSWLSGFVWCSSCRQILW